MARTRLDAPPSTTYSTFERTSYSLRARELNDQVEPEAPTHSLALAAVTSSCWVTS